MEPEQPGKLPPDHMARRFAATIAAVAVLAVVGLGGYELGNLRGTSSPQTASQAIPSPSGSSSPAASSSAIDASKLAAQVDPTVVDVTWTYQGQTSSGTGIILTSNGEVLTNNHVVAGSVQLSVQVAGSGPKYQAKVVGTDVTEDVALIQIEGGSSFHSASIGNSSNVQVGQPVVAIGNALALPGPPTVTQGAITALNRSVTATDQGSGLSENLTNMIQIDAPLEPGNSGGPLVNAAGQVIGMNTAAVTNGQTASTVGFSIPINRALSIASLIQKGEASSTIQIGPPAFLGIEAESVPSAGSGGFGSFGGYGYTPPVSSGALVTAVIPGTPASGAGLVAGDVITSFNGKSISSVGQLTTAIHADKPGQSASIGWVDASGNSHSATITLGSGPAE
ncbi:MAG: trypsin-like peptidase domain-containing protein [Candidatus Dormiibacterota bacterium]